MKLGLSVEPVALEAETARARLTDEHTGLVITGVVREGPAADK